MGKFDGQLPPRQMSDTEDLLYKLLALGTHGESVVAADLARYADEVLVRWAEEKQAILEVITRSAAELSDKPILLGCLVSMVNQRRPEQAIIILESLKSTLDQALQAFNWRESKLLLRVVAVCATMNLVDPMEMLNIYGTLLGVLEEMNPREERKDAFISLVLASLPWCGVVLEQRFAADLQSLMDRIEKYLKEGREKRRLAAKAICAFPSNCPYEQIDSVELLWLQIKNGRSQGWQTPFLAYPLGVELNDGEVHVFGVIERPQDIQGKFYPLLRTRFELLNQQITTRRGFIPQVPEAPSLDYLLVYDVLNDLLSAFEHNIPELIRYLHYSLSIPRTVAQKELLPNIYQPVVELAFTEMLALPASEHKQVFYSFVISELCRQDTKSIPPILGKLIFTIYEHLQDLDVELQCRFSTWFSHHLSNFNYQWNWKEWAHVLESPRHHPAALFVRESMEKCVRLSYWERVGKQLPAGFEVMMPCQPEPTFKYQTGTPFAVDADSISFAQRLLESMRLKQSFEEIQPLVDEIVAYGASKGMTGFDPNEEKGVSLARDIIVQCVLFMGCKSFSHVLNAIERHLKLLESVNSTTEARYETVRIVEDFWYKNHQFLMISLEKLINYKIIEPINVVDWIFAPERTIFYEGYLWQLLKTVVAKMNNRVTQVAKKLENQRILLAAAQEAALKSTTAPSSMEVDGTVAAEASTIAENGTGQESDKAIVEQADTTADAKEVDTQKLAEKLASLSANLDALKRDQKHLFIHVFQQFLRTFKNLNSDTEDFIQNRAWLLGMMREFARWAHLEVSTMSFTLDSVVFTPANDCEELNMVYKAVSCLHA